MKKTTGKKIISKINSTILIALMLFAISASIVYAACGDEGEPACTNTEYASSGDYSKITDWSQVDYTNIDQSKIPEQYISQIPADKVDVTKVSNPKNLNSDQLAYGNNMEKLPLKNLDMTQLSKALGEKYGAAEISVDLLDGNARLENGAIYSGSERITLDQLKNCEAIISTADGLRIIPKANGAQVSVMTGDGQTILISSTGINAETTITTNSDGKSTITLSKNSALTTTGGDGSKITITNTGNNNLAINPTSGDGVTIKGNDIGVNGKPNFAVEIKGDGIYTITKGNEKYTIYSNFKGEVFNDKLWISIGVMTSGETCGSSSPTGLAIADVSGMASTDGQICNPVVKSEIGLASRILRFLSPETPTPKEVDFFGNNIPFDQFISSLGTSVNPLSYKKLADDTIEVKNSQGGMDTYYKSSDIHETRPGHIIVFAYNDEKVILIKEKDGEILLKKNDYNHALDVYPPKQD